MLNHLHGRFFLVQEDQERQADDAENNRESDLDTPCNVALERFHLADLLCDKLGFVFAFGHGGVLRLDGTKRKRHEDSKRSEGLQERTRFATHDDGSEIAQVNRNDWCVDSAGDATEESTKDKVTQVVVKDLYRRSNDSDQISEN